MVANGRAGHKGEQARFSLVIFVRGESAVKAIRHFLVAFLYLES